MIKTLQNTLKQDRERYSVPKSVQDTIPIRRLWQDGVFQFGSKYSKTLRFSDINYAIASKEDKTAMFLRYSELLNALDTGSTTKITINNKRLNRRNFEEEILIPTRGDYLDGGRAEYNAMLLDKVTDSTNSVVQERYITVSAHKKNIEEARTFFSRTVNDITSRLSHMDSHCEELDAVERLRVLHDFYRVGEEMQFQLDLRACMKSGRSCKDAVCPDSMEFKKDHFVMGEKFGRVLFLKEYASYIKDSMIQELTSLDRSLMLSIDIIPVPTDEAVREMQNRLLGVETNVTNWQRRQNNNNNFSAVVPYDLEQQRKETREMLDDLTTRDQRMMFAVVTLVHLADSKEELDSDTETFQSMVRKHLCQLTTLNWQQAEGLVTALPLGVRRIDALRTLTTEALAVLMPFKAQEIRDRGGVYYGQNVISKNLIVADRRQLLNGNGFVLGVSGSGKSFTAKREMVALALSTEDDILVIDPEAEYRPLIEGLGGQVINISATSPNHINAMDMEQGYGDGENPVVLKSEFLLSLCEQLIGAGKLSAKEKSIIDRCTAQVYHDYIRGGYQGETPTLQDFHAELLRQPEGEARDVALAIELFTEGSLNTFAKPTNVDTSARILCYDIRDLGKQLLPVGMLVVLDSIFNRIIRNRSLGRNTWVYIDEIYLLFQHEYSANFLFTLWKRVRKYRACATGISQNVEDLLQSHTARTMLANSEFLVMLNQAATDRVKEKMALVPKEAVHRTVNQGAERLRTQIREVAQEGKRDTFGGDQIEDRTVDGSQLAARGAMRLAKQVQKKQKTERQQVFQQQRVSQVQINRAAQEKRAVQLWLNQESNQQTVNIKSKEVYLSQQTQTPITEVVRTEAAKASGRALRAILAAARTLYAALAAGGMVTLSILVLICLFGVLAASPFGIVYASEDEKADLTLPSAIATLNAEFSGRVEQCKEDYTGQYDRVQVDASAIPNWTDILAVYTVKTSMDKEDPVEVATMDQKKLVLLRKICEEMTPLSATLRSEGEKTVLVIQLQPKTYRQMADEYHFDQEQRKMLEELIDSGLLDLFLEANEPTEEDGPIQPGSGGYAWPLPGYTRISSPFAYRNCPYHGRELHGGIDLPAPRGTSILAAKAGVVAKSTYNASYGNYVVLRHPDGTQTLYAHMSARTVTAGQTVHQGMVIGKVGSTGNSTGNHLHFETWTSSSSGSRVNPMQYF